MIVCKDTYLLADDASEYIEKTYAIGSEAFYWDALTAEQKDAFLAQALRHIEAIPKRGRRYLPMQPLEFPRIYNGMARVDIGAIPQKVAHAQAEEALAIMMAQIKAPLPKGRRLTSAAAEELLREWIPTAIKGVL